MPSNKLSVSKHTLELKLIAKLINSSFFFFFSLVSARTTGWAGNECAMILFHTHTHISAVFDVDHQRNWHLKMATRGKEASFNHHTNTTAITILAAQRHIACKEQMNIFIIYHQPIRMNSHLHVAKWCRLVSLMCTLCLLCATKQILSAMIRRWKLPPHIIICANIVTILWAARTNIASCDVAAARWNHIDR